MHRAIGHNRSKIQWREIKVSITEIIEKILKDEFPGMKDIKANLIANRIQDAIEEFSEQNIEIAN